MKYNPVLTFSQEFCLKHFCLKFRFTLSKNCLLSYLKKICNLLLNYFLYCGGFFLRGLGLDGMTKDESLHLRTHRRTEKGEYQVTFWCFLTRRTDARKKMTYNPNFDFRAIYIYRNHSVYKVPSLRAVPSSSNTINSILGT